LGGCPSWKGSASTGTPTPEPPCSTVPGWLRAGDLGENLTTEGVDLLALPVGTRLRIGEAVITITGLRNPCQQINTFQAGLLKQVLVSDEAGRVRRLAGVMGIVSRSGDVGPGDAIEAEFPPEPHFPLTAV